MNKDLAIIKKKYGDKMMHLCRSLFPTILEQPGILSKLILSRFEPSKFLYDDIINNGLQEKFKNYIYSFINIEVKEELDIIKTPKKLLNEAGYTLYECKTEEDIQSFRKYYKQDEELCTFNGGRLKRCHVFFAVKKNVEEIKRENFTNPKREDEYGTSVISIQFSRGKINTLSIKNRYNHRVNNPDATFNNNLDNIIEGLTISFEKNYNLNLINSKISFELPGYVKANNGKFYKYNYEINNIYYCPNNIIIDNFEAINTYEEKEKYIIVDYFIIDLINKEIKIYDKTIEDSFIDIMKNIKKITVTKIKETGSKKIEITCLDENKIIIEIDKTNKITKYYNENIKEVGNHFLAWNESLTEINLPNLEVSGNQFIARNKYGLAKMNLPKLKEVGDEFLYCNESLTEINLPNLEKVGDNFFGANENLLPKINLPKLKEIGYWFFDNNTCLTEINLPKLEKVGNQFLRYNRELTKLNLPNLEKVGDDFLCCNENLVEINLPKLEKAGHQFFGCNNSLTKMNLPNLKIVGDNFIGSNNSLIEVNLPKLKEAGSYFLEYNNNLTEINLPNLEKIKDNFLYYNISLNKLKLPKLKQIGNNFLYCNNSLTEINLPNLEKVEDEFLYCNTSLIILNLPNLENIGDNFLYCNNSLTSLNLPNLKKTEAFFLYYNTSLTNINLPKLRKKGKNFLKKLKTATKENKDEQITKTKQTSSLVTKLIEQVINDENFYIENNQELLINEQRRGR